MTKLENNSKETNTADSNIIDYDKIIKLYEQRFEIQERGLTAIVSALAILKDDSPNEIKVLWNIAGFVSIISYDIKVITRDMILAQNDWQQRHYARQACLIIYESINDLFELLGKDFKSLSMSHAAGLLIQIKKFRSDLNEFKDKYHKKLYEIRNTSIAHREKEVLKQLSIIVKIDWNEILNMTIEFEYILRNLDDFVQNFFKEVIKR